MIERVRNRDIPARPAELTATCGHAVPWSEDPADPHREAKRAKVLGRKCPACRQADARAHDEAQKRAAIERALKQALEGGVTRRKVKKGQEPTLLPSGTRIELIRCDDGRWTGVLEAMGITVEAEGAGLMGMASTLARRWLKARGATVQGRVS